MVAVLLMLILSTSFPFINPEVPAHCNPLKINAAVLALAVIFFTELFTNCLSDGTLVGDVEEKKIPVIFPPVPVLVIFSTLLLLQ